MCAWCVTHFAFFSRQTSEVERVATAQRCNVNILVVQIACASRDPHDFFIFHPVVFHLRVFFTATTEI
jgi:hypothetical protein